MLKSDLHIHTEHDFFDRIKHSTEELIDTAVAGGFEVLGITNHNSFFDCSRSKDYAEKKGILIIPGIETTVEGKHVVILNAVKEAEKVKSFGDLRKYRQEHPECFVLAPHPYYFKISSLDSSLEENIELFDGIEYCYFHSRLVNFFNRKAEATAKKFNKPLIGTSDNHYLERFGKTYTLINAEKNINSIIEAMKKGKVELVSNPFSEFELARILFPVAWNLLNYFRRRRQLK